MHAPSWVDGIKWDLSLVAQIKSLNGLSIQHDADCLNPWLWLTHTLVSQEGEITNEYNQECPPGIS